MGMTEVKMDVEDIKGIILHLIGCLLIAYSGYLFGTASLPDHGNGAGQVRNELQRTEEYQRQAEQRVGEAAGTASGIAGSIESGRKAVTDAQGTARLLEGNIGRAGAIIAECQQITAGVRARGPVKAPAQ
jgi:hypothetical protein